MSELNDLLRRFLEEGDARAMEQIVAKTRPRLLGAARRIGNPHDAEDSVQAAYHALLRRGDKPMDAPLIAWLLTVVVRIAYRRKAIEQREQQLADQLALPSDEPGPRRIVEIAERDRNLRAEVGRLPPHYRDAVILRYLEGLSIRECARLLDTPEETVRTRLKRARRLLRGRLHPRIAHGLLALPWWLADSARPTVSSLGVVMKTKIAVVGFLIALAGLLYLGRDLGRSEAVERTDTARPGAAGADAGSAESARSTASLRNDERDAEETLPAPVDFAAVDRDRDVHGTVVDGQGKPVAGALLQLLDYPWRRARLLNRDRRFDETLGPTARSARDGTFRIPWQRARMGWLRVTTDSYAERLVPMVQAGERLEITLSDGARVVVVAKDEEGRPVAGANVRYFHAQSRTTGQSFAREHKGATDADGRCLLRGVQGPSQGYLELDHADLGWPSWTPVTVPEEGESVEVEVVFPHGRTLRGRVTDADSGAPIAGVRVGIGWVQHVSVETDAGGRYELPGWSGRGADDIHVSHPDYGRASAVVGAQREIDFVLRAGDRVRGRLVDPAGAAVAGARIAAIGSVHDGVEQTTSRGYGESAADGSFEIGGLRHDMFHALVVMKPGFGRVLFDFEPADEIGGVIDLGRIELRRGISIEGRVVDGSGNALARVPVTVHGTNTDRGRYAPKKTDQNMSYGEQEERYTDDLGRFRFPDLAPGEYTLSARRDGGDRTERIVTLGVEGIRDFVLPFEATRLLTVRVVDPDGHPVPSAYVSSFCEGRNLGGRTDPDGNAVLRAAGPVTQLQVQFVRAGDGAAPYLLPPPIARVSEDKDEIEIVLERGEPVTGTVLQPDGIALPRALVEVWMGEKKLTPAITDSSGRFRVIVPPGARVDLVFGGAANEQHFYEHKFQGALRGVAAGSTDQVLRLQPIARDGSLKVVVLDPDGRPVPDRDVWCAWGNERSAAVRTNAEGRAVFSDLPRLDCTPIVVLTDEDRRHWVPAFGSAVKPDGREVVLRMRKGVFRSGVVKPATGAYVMFEKVEGDKRTWLGGVRTGDDGRFSVLLPTDQGDGPFVVTAYPLTDASNSVKVEGVMLSGPELVIELKTKK